MNKQVRITRAQHSTENPYFLMARATAQDERLSFEARGLLAYLLSKPDGWEVKVFDLTQNCGENRVYRILKELRSNGYMTFQRTRGEDGHFNGGVYQVYETPRDENPDVDNSRVENRDDLYKTDGEENIDTEKKQKKGKTPTPIGGDGNSHTDLIKAWLDTSKVIDPAAYAKKTHHQLAQAMLNSGVTPDDVRLFIEHRRLDKFWKDKAIRLNDVASSILAWKSEYFPKPNTPKRDEYGHLPGEPLASPEQLAESKALMDAILTKFGGGK